jgi:hypothetical protein
MKKTLMAIATSCLITVSASALFAGDLSVAGDAVLDKKAPWRFPVQVLPPNNQSFYCSPQKTASYLTSAMRWTRHRKQMLTATGQPYGLMAVL